MTPIEIIALITALVAAIKILVILVRPKKWAGVINTTWKKPGLMMVSGLVLAGIVLYYLLLEITIVQIFAVMAFLALIACVSISAYSSELKSFAQKLLKDRNVVKKAALSLIIWIILILWVLKELFL